MPSVLGASSRLHTRPPASGMWLAECWSSDEGAGSEVSIMALYVEVITCERPSIRTTSGGSLRDKEKGGRPQSNTQSIRVSYAARNMTQHWQNQLAEQHPPMEGSIWNLIWSGGLLVSRLGTDDTYRYQRYHGRRINAHLGCRRGPTEMAHIILLKAISYHIIFHK